MNRKLIAIIVLGLVLLASLLACGYFGIKTVRRTRLRRAAMTAFEKKDYVLAERLLRQYVQKDPNAEAEFAALANIYHEYGNAGMEAQMWQTASSLNPLNREYRENMLTSAAKAIDYELLYSILGRKLKLNEDFSDQELYLYVISACRAHHLKDVGDVYQKRVKENPEAFRKNDLGRLAEFLATAETISAGEQDNYLNKAMESEDPTARFEAIFYKIRQIRKQDGGMDRAEEIEDLLKKAAETNFYAGTQYLADFYFSKYRFDDVAAVLDPYLKKIDEANMYMLYAESCVFTNKLDELKALEKKLRRKPGAMQLLADYCEILIAYLENDEEKLASAVRKSGSIIISPLSRFIRLRVAMQQKSFGEIRAVAQEIFSSAPFHDLHMRAMLICLDYIAEEMDKPENRKDPSQMAELAKILSGYLHGNRLLTEIILMDQYKKGLAKEADLMAALEEFPDDPLLQRLSAEYLLFNGKAEQALSILEQVLAAAKEENREPERRIQFLQMLALDQLERRDEASDIFRELVEKSEFDLELLDQYFQYCTENDRGEDLMSMADNLDAVKDGKLEHFGKFFRAAALLLSEDESRENEALDLLASTPTGDPDLTFYAANRLSEHDRFDEAEAKYKAILKTYFMPPLIYVNLSELYHAKGDEQKAMEAAKEAFELEKKSMLPAFIYAKRLSEANRYEEAVDVLKFPRHAVTYREDVVELWADCMRHIIEKDMAEQRLNQAEEQCKHLLVIVPDDAFGTETLAKIREALKQKKDDTRTGDAGAAPAA